MKPISLRTVALAAPIFSLLAVANCAPDDTTTPPVTGTAGSGTAGSGTAGSGTAGITGTSGNTGTSGSVGTGGASTAGTGGVGTAGAATAGNSAGGTTAGTGGVGTAGTGGAPPAVTVDGILSGASDFGNAGWKDSWWVTGCNVKAGHDCITVPDAQCHSTDDAAGGSEGKGARTIEKFPVGGVAGQHYKVTFSFNAVTEAKKYDGGKRDVTGVAADVESGISDTFYRDGNSPASNYNVIKMTVFDDKNMPVRHFYMNSFPDTSYESHRTFLASYKKVIVIVGGGHVEHLVQDSNCHAIDNCGAGNVSDTECNGARSLPGGDNALMLPAKYKDPKDGTLKNTPLVAPGIPGASLAQPWHAQAGHLKVTAIEATNDPVTMDYPNP
jgi:hypothetical protein